MHENTQLRGDPGPLIMAPVTNVSCPQALRDSHESVARQRRLH